MGRQSREHKERRERRLNEKFRCSAKEGQAGQNPPDRAGELEEELKHLSDGDAVFWTSPSCPSDVRESNLEDVLAFESVESGTSMFAGLEEHGVTLPRPEELDERQSAEKSIEVLRALAELRIFLVGFEGMGACEFYSRLWHQTLWEGCYVEKRYPGAVTIIDVSHKIPRSELLNFLEELKNGSSIH